LISSDDLPEGIAVASEAFSHEIGVAGLRHFYCSYHIPYMSGNDGTR
jgi:hypothetical protein